MQDAEFTQRAYDLAVAYGYIDEAQEDLLRAMIDGTIAQLKDSGVPAQNDNPEYLMAVAVLSAYRYSRRTAMPSSVGAFAEDMQYKSMLLGWVWRLRGAQ